MQNKNDNIEQDIYIDNYLDGNLDEGAIDLFERKCLEDKAFFRSVKERQRFREAVKSVAVLEGATVFADQKVQPVSRTARVQQWWRTARPVWKYSLAPASVLALLVLMVLLRTDGAFRENSQLESMLGGVSLRSESAAIEILSPGIGEKIKGEVHFSWRTGGQNKLQLIVMDNQGKEVAEFRTSESSFEYEKPLNPGLFYWHLIADGDRVFTGKFIIEK